MTLADARFGEKLRVLGRGEGGRLGESLSGIGIHIGDEVVVVRAAPFHGPLLVEVPSSGVRVALGRGMAEKVLVEPANAVD